MFGIVGETVGQQWVSDRTGPVPAGVEAYKVLQVTTLSPSFQGAATGAYDDPLQPVSALSVGSKYWVEARIASVGVKCFGTLLCLIGKAGPMVPMPMYMEMGHSAIGAAAGLPDDGQHFAARVSLTLAFSAMLRSNGVEPIKQWISPFPPVANGKLDLDTPYNTANPLSTFRNMVLTSNVAPPMIFSWSTPATDALLTAVKATALPADSWIYTWDEGEGTADAQALAQAQRYKTTGLHIMETRNWSSTFSPYVDWFFTIGHALPQGPAVVGGYVSCMSQGSCTTGITNPPNGEPMMLVDSPRVHQRAFAWVLSKYGVQRALYYNSTEMLSTALQPGGQRGAFQGNGDGTEVYYGTDGQPWPSLRLKYIQRGLQDVWYLKHGGVNPVVSPTSWPQSESVYEAERARVWGTLP